VHMLERIRVLWSLVVEVDENLVGMWPPDYDAFVRSLIGDSCELEMVVVAVV
jgi:hypothetical protein